MTLDALAELVEGLSQEVSRTAKRFVLGVAGPPGAGKSTVAAQIVGLADTDLGAIVVPMDGFHRTNEELTALGLLDLKGIPDSFDAQAFAAHMRRLRREETLSWPAYDRARSEVVRDGILVSPTNRLVVVEGNYLLLNDPPWVDVRRLVDDVWYLDAPTAVITPRLLARHRLKRGDAGALAKVASTDLPNAQLVDATKHLADVRIMIG